MSRAQWIDGDDVPAPRGTKILILTKYGICVVGCWKDADSVAWQHLPDTSPTIKHKMMMYATGRGDEL